MTSSSSARAALELSPCTYCDLIWDFSLGTHFCSVFFIQSNGLWHDEEYEEGVGKKTLLASLLETPRNSHHHHIC